MVTDLGVTYTQLNRAISVNFVGLALGCVFFIPVAKKYGRRPIYLVSTALMLATSFWAGEIQGLGGLYATNLIQGLAGATNEAIAQITVCSHLAHALLTCPDLGPLLPASPRGNEWLVHDGCDGRSEYLRHYPSSNWTIIYNGRAS